MAFLIVLNNKEPYFLMGLLFFISNDNMCRNRNATLVGI
jgi:hypothetical protein